MAPKYLHLPLQDLPKFIQIWIYGLKIYHPATLVGDQMIVGIRSPPVS
jgi:hypothetical protein